MIEADFAEFVDDDQSTGERRIAQQGVQETGFAGPQKTGDDGQREGRGRAGDIAGRKEVMLPRAV